MNARSLAYLAGATLLVAIVAAVTLRHRESAVQATSASGKLFPDLGASINEVASVELKREDGTTTLQRSGDVWGLAEKSAYPVDMAAVRKTLIGVSELAGSEPKTEDPKLYSKLGVEDPATEGSTSTLLTLKDRNGRELAAVIVGKDHASKTFAGPPQVYVRKPGEARSWLATGDLGLKEKSTDWLDKKILEIKRERVRAVEIRHGDGEVVRVDRDKPETKDFTLHDLPEGKELSYPSAPGSLADALGYLNLEDVVPASEVDMSEGTSTTARFSCFDGLTVTVTTKTVGDKTYARFEASYEKPPEPSTPPPPAADGEKEAETPEESGEEPKEPAATTTPQKSAEEIQAEAARLNERIAKWAYVIPSYNKSSFQKRRSELLKDKTPPPPPSPSSGVEGSSEASGGALTPPPSPPEEDPESNPPTPPKEKDPEPEKPPEAKPPRFGVFGLG